MNILLSSSGALDRGFGGGQIYVQRLACELRRRGHQVTVITPIAWPGGRQDVAVERYHYQDIPVIGLCANPERVRPEEHAAETGKTLAEALRRQLTELAPEVVHINGWKALLTTLCREMGIPHVVTAHHPGIACPAGALLTPESTICRVAMSAKNCVSCYCRQRGRGGLPGKLLGRLPAWIYRPLGRLLARLGSPTYLGRVLMYPYLVESTIAGRRTALANAELFIAPSRAIAEVVRRNGVEVERIQVVAHGIEPMARMSLLPFERRPLRFGYVGQITRGKGLHVLFEAFASLPAEHECELHIIGGAQHPWEERYLAQSMACCRGGRRVVLHGHVPHAELERAIAEFDVLVLPAIGMEVFGLTIPEAFSCGRPAIVTACGGPEETVRDGVDGRVIPPNDIAALRAAMQELIQDPSKVVEMAANIRPVRTLQEHCDDLEAAYRCVAQGAPRAKRMPHVSPQSS